MSTGEPPVPPKVLLCVGPERWLMRQAIERIQSQCVAPGFEETDFVRLTEEAEAAQILEAAATLPFGPDRRLVVVEGLEQISAENTPWFLDYLKQPNPKTVLLLCAEELDASLSRIQSKQLQIIWCRSLKGGELQGWLAAQAKAFSKRLEPRAGFLLAARVGVDLNALSLALESLSCFVADQDQITAADVERLIPPAYQETAFEILDSAASGRPELALNGLHQGLRLGRLTLEQFLGALGWYYRMVWKAQQGQGAGGFASGARRAALLRLARWPRPKLEKALGDLLEADASIKFGHPAPELLVDQLLIQLGS